MKITLTRPRAVIATVAIAGLITTATTGSTSVIAVEAAQPPTAAQSTEGVGLGAEEAALAVAGLDEAALAANLEAGALDLTSFSTAGTEASFEVEPLASADAPAAARALPAEGAGAPATVSVDFIDATTEIQVQTDATDPASLTTLQLEIREATPELIAFAITDPATGETVEYRSDEATPSFAPAIPIGIAIGAAAWAALVKTVAVVVVAGAAYVAYSSIVEAVRANNQYQHYAVIIRSGGLFLGKGMSLSDAATWGRGGNDTWSKTQAGARQVAQNVKNGRAPVGPEIDAQGSGKFHHYHPNNRQPAMHAFYGAPRG